MKNIQILFGWLTITLAASQFCYAEDFKVGVLLCLTGSCSEIGQNAMHGVELAAEELNAHGGVLGDKIVLVSQDTKEMESPANAVSAFRNLRLDPAIKYFIGPTWTVGGLPLAPIVSKDKSIIITSPSLGVADFNEAGDNVFNTWPHDSIGTKALAKFAVDKEMKRGAIFSDQGPWESKQADIFEEEYKRLGGTVSVRVDPLPNTNDVRTEAQRIINSHPTVVFFSAYTLMGLGSRELRQLGYKGQIITILMDDTQLKAAQGALDGAIYAQYGEPTSDFVKHFTDKFHEAPGAAADTGYDTLYLYARAIEAAKSFDVKAVQPKILATELQGASGKITFDAKGGVVKTPKLFVVKGNEKKALE